MEALFALLSIVIVSLENIAPAAARSLEYILHKMEDEWNQLKSKNSRLAADLEDEVNWSNSRTEKIEQLRAQVLNLENDVKSFTNILPLNAMWYVLVPAFWVKFNPVHAIKVLRDVFAASGKGQLGLKEAVGFRNDIIAKELDLFVGQPLTTLEMLAAAKALEVAGRPWSEVTISYCYQVQPATTQDDDEEALQCETDSWDAAAARRRSSRRRSLVDSITTITITRL